jgi:hypothetical protein
LFFDLLLATCIDIDEREFIESRAIEGKCEVCVERRDDVRHARRIIWNTFRQFQSHAGIRDFILCDHARL